MNTQYFCWKLILLSMDKVSSFLLSFKIILSVFFFMLLTIFIIIVIIFKFKNHLVIFNYSISLKTYSITQNQINKMKKTILAIVWLLGAVKCNEISITHWHPRKATEHSIITRGLYDCTYYFSTFESIACWWFEAWGVYEKQNILRILCPIL